VIINHQIKAVCIGLIGLILSNLAFADELKTLGCMLEPSKKVDISSPIPGVVSVIKVKRGDVVNQGSTLVQLTDGRERASVEMAKAKMEFAKRNVERNQKLYQEELLSPHERDEIETEFRMADLEYRLKQEELKLRTIVSPIHGVVVDRYRDSGEYVNSEAVLSLATLNPLHVDLLLPSYYFGTIVKGQNLLIKPDLPGFDSRKAVVTIIDPIIDSASGTFRVQLELDNFQHKIPAGMRCSVQQAP
jgi:membrane fusion protein, multidrug efflux system